MLIEVHAPQKPGIPLRAILATALLMTITSLLAASMAWKRKNAPPAIIFKPPGWSVTFRPPRGFPAFGEDRTKLGHEYRFFPDGPNRDRVVIIISRLGPKFAGGPYLLSNRVLDLLSPRPLLIMGTGRQSRPDVALGPIKAYELWDPVLNIVVRAGRLGDTDAYAVLVTSSGLITPDLYARFEQTCDSVRIRSR